MQDKVTDQGQNIEEKDFLKRRGEEEADMENMSIF
jgi:hypothetical protein